MLPCLLCLLGRVERGAEVDEIDKIENVKVGIFTNPRVLSLASALLWCQLHYSDSILLMSAPLELLQRGLYLKLQKRKHLLRSRPGGSLEGNLLTLAARLSEILVETEKTADGFMRDNQALAATTASMSTTDSDISD